MISRLITKMVSVSMAQSIGDERAGGQTEGKDLSVMLHIMSIFFRQLAWFSSVCLIHAHVFCIDF